MIESISGIVTAIMIIILSRVLSNYFPAKLFAATIVVAIAFIYVGFSLKGNSISSIVLEAGVALIFYFGALLGYTKNNLLLAYGIILHGMWDIFHHKGFLIGTDIPDYWPSFCLIVDIIDGLYFVIVFKKQKKHQRIIST
ncbi:MAG: DUF6010 family protein [Ferruginibacter sp.]